MARMLLGLSGLTIAFITLVFEIAAFAWLGANDFINPYTMWGLLGFPLGLVVAYLGDRPLNKRSR